ncbi:MAG: Fe(3+) ABC transporter substrate-binding protein [Proteobacteria bacterium]|nr:Fe(3+) ABC transporter substrate-binding protein [Pseudomonadota bacterium]
MRRFIIVSIVMAFLATTSIATTIEEVNVYSARKEALIKPLLDSFTKQTGIKVNLVTGKADALLKRLITEGINTPADLFLTVDAGRLYRAKQAKVLQAISNPALLAAVPESYRDPEGYWYGLSLRARVIVFSKERVKAIDLSSYENLADPKWKKRICIRSSDNIYNQSLVASMIVANGEVETEKWAKGLVENMARKPKGGDRDQVRAIAAGQCDVALINTYYYGQMLNAIDEPKTQAAANKVTLFWPNQQDRGTHINVSGAGITAHAKNKQAAIKLLQHLLSPEAQYWYSEINYEYPVQKSLRISDILDQWGDFKADNINMEKLGNNNVKAVMLMDRVNWH